MWRALDSEKKPCEEKEDREEKREGVGLLEEVKEREVAKRNSAAAAAAAALGVKLEEWVL